MALIKRQLYETVNEHLDKYPVSALTGPRQSGKTTLLKSMFPGYQYMSLEDPTVRKFATEDMAGFLKKYNRKIIFDEAQRVPELFSWLQTEADSSTEMGRFILSGSQNFHLMEKITQSLAGRVALFKLFPYDFREMKNGGLLPDNWRKLIIRGCYPAIYTRDLHAPMYYSNYVNTYVKRDLTTLTNIHDMQRFNVFLKLCAGRAGQILNLSNLANETGISHTTARSWLTLLEACYIVFLLPPYFENFNKRVVKSPKLYFYDTGLLSWLLGYRKEEDVENPVTAGPLFENLIVSECIKENEHTAQLKEFWYWRDSHGHEVDLLVKQGDMFDIFEIKSTETVLPRLFEGLDYFDKISGGRVREKYLVYGGTEDQDWTNYKVRGWCGNYH